jgi:hypothetical protein
VKTIVLAILECTLLAGCINDKSMLSENILFFEPASMNVDVLYFISHHHSYTDQRCLCGGFGNESSEITVPERSTTEEEYICELEHAQNFIVAVARDAVKGGMRGANNIQASRALLSYSRRQREKTV